MSLVAPFRHSSHRTLPLAAQPTVSCHASPISFSWWAQPLVSRWYSCCLTGSFASSRLASSICPTESIGWLPNGAPQRLLSCAVTQYVSRLCSWCFCASFIGWWSRRTLCNPHVLRYDHSLQACCCFSSQQWSGSEHCLGTFAAAPNPSVERTPQRRGMFASLPNSGAAVAVRSRQT